MSRNFQLNKELGDVIVIQDSDIPLESGKQRPCVIVDYDEESDEYLIVALSSQPFGFGSIEKIQLDMGSYISIPLEETWIPSIVVKYAHKIDSVSDRDWQLITENLR